MNSAVATELLAYCEARKARRAEMLRGLFPKQRAAATDPSRLKAWLCTRRAGKSWAIGLLLFLTAIDYPGCSCLYLGLTRGSAHGIMLKDICERINVGLGIGAKWVESKSRYEVPGGSFIYLRGADANSYEIKKVVGQKYRLAVLDEASKYRYDLYTMVYESLLPAMGDDLGTIILSGTPSNITRGLYYDATTKGYPGWSVHRWSWKDNVYNRENVQKLHDDVVASNPAFVGTPLYRQEWLGEWQVDLSALVYRYAEDKNSIDRLPKPAHEYTYVLGVDLGFKDPTALVVVAYHPNDPTLYVVETHKRSGIIIDTVAAMVRSLWHCPSLGCAGPYPFAAMVCDASALQGVEEMRQKHHLPLEAAEKQGKQGVIEVMNSDLATGRVKLLPGNDELVKEWSALIWDEAAKARFPVLWREAAGFENHLADAALYAWRKSRNYDAVPARPPEPVQGTEAWEAARFERQLAHARRLREQGGSFLDEMPPWVQRQMGDYG